MSARLDRMLGGPIGISAREADFAERQNNVEANITLFAARIEQLTNKSAALLQADSIFIAVALFVIQVRQSSVTGSIALILLTSSCLLLASNLWAVWPRRGSEGKEQQLRLMHDIRIWRGVRFNLALYFFFGGVAVLSLSAIA
jgi:hypothetical protein